MKNNIIYAAVFAAAFILVTGGIIYLNDSYKNIFYFDFTPAAENKTGEKKKDKPSELDDLMAKLSEMEKFSIEFKKEILDTIKTITLPAADSSIASVDSSLIDSIRTLQKALAMNSNNDSVSANVKAFTEKTKKDSVYLKWTKSTASLYESMDARKAAKIIQNYSDNVARDILYAMKKKKAADVLANIEPETANRITRIR